MVRDAVLEDVPDVLVPAELHCDAQTVRKLLGDRGGRSLIRPWMRIEFRASRMRRGGRRGSHLAIVVSGGWLPCWSLSRRGGGSDGGLAISNDCQAVFMSIRKFTTYRIMGMRAWETVAFEEHAATRAENGTGGGRERTGAQTDGPCFFVPYERVPRSDIRVRLCALVLARARKICRCIGTSSELGLELDWR